MASVDTSKDLELTAALMLITSKDTELKQAKFDAESMQEAYKEKDGMINKL